MMKKGAMPKKKMPADMPPKKMPMKPMMPPGKGFGAKPKRK